MFEIRVHGLGGQGAVTLCTWVARAGYAMGKHVQAFPFFGAERRGAPVKAFVRLADEPIDLRSQVYRPDLLVVMSADLTGIAVREGMSETGRLLLNAGEELAGKLAERLGMEIHYLDATGIAIDLGLEIEGMPMVNLPLFGAMVRESEAAPFETAMEILESTAGGRNLEVYEEAARLGFETVRSAGAKEHVG